MHINILLHVLLIREENEAVCMEEKATYLRPEWFERTNQVACFRCELVALRESHLKDPTAVFETCHLVDGVPVESIN